MVLYFRPAPPMARKAILSISTLIQPPIQLGLAVRRNCRTRVGFLSSTRNLAISASRLSYLSKTFLKSPPIEAGFFIAAAMRSLRPFCTRHCELLKPLNLTSLMEINSPDTYLWNGKQVSIRRLDMRVMAMFHRVIYFHVL